MINEECPFDHGIHQFYEMIDMNTRGVDIIYCKKCGKKKE